MVVELVQAAHQPQPSGGEWQLRESHEFGIAQTTGSNATRLPKSKGLGVSKCKVSPDKGAKQARREVSSLVLIERFEDSISTVTGGAPTLEKQILETVARERLYHLGRFETAENQVSLGWVSIGPLLAGTPQHATAFSSSTPLLPLVISQMQEWLAGKVKELQITDDPSSVVLLGIDCWGAVMSSQLSVMTGWRNFCIAGRGDGAHHTTFERVTHRVIREISAASLVVFVADVIASGHSLRHIQEDIMQKMPKGKGAKGRPKWLAAGILCDELTERGSELDFLHSIGCACKMLRLPLIAPVHLPDRHILPATLRFTGSESSPKASASPTDIAKPDRTDGDAHPSRSPIARPGREKVRGGKPKKSRG